MYFFKCQKFVFNGLKKKKIPEIEDFAALGAYIINYIRVLVPDDAYLKYVVFLKKKIYLFLY